MKAKLIAKRITLDYTGISEPLKIEDVAADISEVNAYQYQEPEVIVLWEHQADWLTKQQADWLTKQLGSRCAVFSDQFDNRVGDNGQPGGNGRRVTTIYGVPVRYANL